MKKRDRAGLAYLDELIEEIAVDANGEDEQLWAFLQALEDNVPVPCEATVIGEPVQVMKFGYDGNERRGLTATCRRADGAKHVVAASEVVIPLSMQGGRYLAAYRQWMGMAPFPHGARGKTRRQPAAAPHLDGPLELVVLSVKQKAARCRLLGSDRTFTFRAGRLWEVAPGEIAVVRPAKQWTYAGNPYLSGVIESTRLDARALGLVPLRLEERGPWDPAEHYWGEPGDPIGKWAKPIAARGKRPMFEMEQVLPGADPGNFSDPIIESNDSKDSGDRAGAYKMLMDLCQADLRCLDAHAHLGNLVFHGRPRDAIRHYEAGFRIGELSLGEGFDGVLPWGCIDNRPFLRCMHGFGICLWRLRRFEEAARIFDRMLWLNPTDNQGARFVIGQVRAKAAWVDDR
ncbi:MAG: tetratricopeptide repeat protein [Acidobacteria bacterium]|nr:tetratricopeptide repeat protein [Acidobacteriota bacterium]